MHYDGKDAMHATSTWKQVTIFLCAYGDTLRRQNHNTTELNHTDFCQVVIHPKLLRINEFQKPNCIYSSYSVQDNVS